MFLFHLKGIDVFARIDAGPAEIVLVKWDFKRRAIAGTAAFQSPYAGAFSAIVY